MCKETQIIKSIKKSFKTDIELNLQQILKQYPKYLDNIQGSNRLLKVKTNDEEMSFRVKADEEKHPKQKTHKINSLGQFNKLN